MDAKPFFLMLSCVALLLTACHKRTVAIVANGTMATADELKLKDSDAGSDGNVTVTWKSSTGSPWLVQFPGATPCGAGGLIQSGLTEECVIKVSKMALSYKYFAFTGAAHSQDPVIVHDTGILKPSSLTVRQPVFFCLDLTSGSPNYCNNGEPPQSPASPSPLQGVSALDDIYWQPSSGWTITIDTGACNQGTSITPKQPYCTVSSSTCSGSDAYCTYNYNVTSNGSTKGPFQIQVNKP